MTSANDIRETLRYAARFRGQVFVVRLDDLQPDFGLLDDLRIVLAAGVKLAIICEADSHAHTALGDFSKSIPVHNNEQIVEAIKSHGIALTHYRGNEFASINNFTIELARQLSASKILFMSASDGVHNEAGLIHEMNIEEAQELLAANRVSPRHNTHQVITGKMRGWLETAIKALTVGVERVQILGACRDGTLLQELFSATGSGTLIYDRQRGYATIRPATAGDIPEILRLLSTSQTSNHARHDIEIGLQHVIVRMLDDQVTGCAMINTTCPNASLRFVAAAEPINPILTELMEYAFQAATEGGATTVTLLTPNQDWLFISPVLARLGFKPSSHNKHWQAHVV